MAAISRSQAEKHITQIFKEYIKELENAKNSKRKLPPEANVLFEGLEDFAYFVRYGNLQKNIYDRLNLQGINELLNGCKLLAYYYELPCYNAIKDAEAADDKNADEESFWDTFLGALQGEFNENPSGKEILIDMGLNFIPFVGQACDVRDIAACLKKLVVDRRADEVMVWVTLLLTAVGCVPYAGDVIKAGCKAILKGADGIVLTVLRKLDAEDVYKAFKIFKTKFTSCIDDAIAMVSKWIEKAGKSKYGSKINDVLGCASEKLNQATDYVKKQIDEFEERVFKTGKKGATKFMNIPNSNGSLSGTAGNSKGIPGNKQVAKIENLPVKGEEKNILENITKNELVESVESFQNSVSNNVETKFIGELRGEKITLYDVKVGNIYYAKRSSEELITLRNEFNTVTRKSFLKELGKNPEGLKLAGLSDSEILKIQNGRVPNGWQVHHKLPLDDSGTNTFDNLVLIQNEPYHKAITNYQNSMSVNMNVGDTKNLKWPIPNNNIYPTTK